MKVYREPKRCRGVAALLFVLVCLIGLRPVQAEEAGPRILAGTGIVADILHDLCGGQARVRLLIPGGACPGHYDLRPGDLRFLGEADLLVLEGFQPEMPNMQNLVRAAENEDLRLLALPLEKAPMLPDVQKRMTLDLAERLAQLWPERAGAFALAAARRVERIDAVQEQATSLLRAAGLGEQGPAALCSRLQAPLAAWAGLEVAGTYGRPEDLTQERFRELVDAGREHGVRVVLDNVQSGPGAGTGLAETLGAGQADLTSFPGGVSGEDDWASAFLGNVRRLLAALASAN